MLFALGNTACQLGLAGAAEQFYRRVLTQDPCRTEAIVNLSNLLRANGQFDAAIALLIPAVAREPKSHELQLTLGSAWRERGDLERAKLHYQAALVGHPDYALALANLADLLCDEGQRDVARTLYDKAIKVEPKNAQARMNRAILHFLNGDLKRAGATMPPASMCPARCRWCPVNSVWRPGRAKISRKSDCWCARSKVWATISCSRP